MSNKKSSRKAERNSPPLDPLLKLDDVAGRLKISIASLYKLMNEGLLESVMVLNRRYVTARQFGKYIRSLEAEPAAAPKDSASNRFRPTKKPKHHRKAAT